MNRAPLPPNRACRSPAHGSPVDGLPQRGLSGCSWAGTRLRSPCSTKNVESRQHAVGPDGRFNPRPWGSGLCDLLSSQVEPAEHCRRLVFRSFVHSSSISLEPFAPPELPGFVAPMVPLTPAGRLSGARQVSSLHGSNLPIVLSPTTPRRSGCLTCFSHPNSPSGSAGWPSHPLGRVPLDVTWASPLASRLAATTGRIEFVILRTDRSPPGALHLPSRERSSSRLRSPSPAPTGTFTPLVRHTHDRTGRRFSTCGIPSRAAPPTG